MNSPRIAIVGAGPVGLTAALLLHQQGLKATIYERRSDTVQLPQAHVVNTRTCEIYRELGIFERLAEAASPDDKLQAVTWRETVAGQCFGVLQMVPGSERSNHLRAQSPARTLNIGQDTTERILLDELVRTGGSVLFEHTVKTVAIEEGKAALEIQAKGEAAGRREVFDYVLACDGASSTIRQTLDIAMQGPASIARYASCYFKADLNRYFGKHLGPVHFIGGLDVSGSLICFDMKDTWALMCVMPPNATREQFSEATMLELVRRSIGDPEVDVKLVSVGSWNMSAQIAERFRQGPVFLVGDAAHRFPPTGGLGLNSGVQDAHNLVWKIAMVARNAADKALLDTYDAERRPVATRNSEQSVRNAMNLMEVDAAIGIQVLSPVDPSVVQRPALTHRDYGIEGDSVEAAEKRKRIEQAIAHQHAHFGSPRIEIGYRYGEGEWGPDTDFDAIPGIAVGARLPHTWIEADGKRISTLDLPARQGYTLLVAEPSAELESLAPRLAEHGVQMRPVPRAGLFVEERSAVLVRPDGHILWHGERPGTELLAAIGQLHSGEIQRDAPPVRTITESEKATMTTPPRQGIRPAKLAHVVLRTNERFDEVCEWYRDLLSADIGHKDMMTCFMTYDDEHHRIAVIRAPGMSERPPGTVGVEHFAFTYTDLSDLLETYARLKQKGVEPIVTINHGATTSLYYEDPDRNRVELQVDNFETAAELGAFFQSGAMGVNPIGMSFDADEMLAKLRAGVPAKTLQAYPIPPGPMEPKVLERLGRN